MVIWQFMALAILIGAFVAYASVITRRLGYTNARLRRIEEALISTSRALELAAESKAKGSNKEHSAGYLTVRELKVMNEQRKSRATHSSGRDAAGASESGNVPKTTRAPKRSRRAAPAELGDLVKMGSESRARETGNMRANSVPTFLTSHAPAETVGEPLDLSALQTMTDDSDAMSSESRDAAVPVGEPRSGPILQPAGGGPPSGRSTIKDSAAKRNQDALLYLSNQRRRRRAH